VDTLVESDSDLIVTGRRVPLTQAVIDFKVGLFRSRSRLGRAGQAAGTFVLPGDTSTIRHPVRSTAYRAATPGTVGVGRLGRRIGGGAMRCPAGFEFGGRFAQGNFANCGRQVFEVPADAAGRLGATARNATAATRRLLGTGNLPGAPEGRSRRIGGGLATGRAVQIARNANIPEVGAVNAGRRDRAVTAAIGALDVDRERQMRLVRRDGVTLTPTVGVDSLRKLGSNPDMDGAVLVRRLNDPADMGTDEIPALLSSKLRQVTFAFPDGGRVDITKRRDLTPTDQRRLAAAFRRGHNAQPNLNYDGGINAAVQASGGALSYTGRFTGVSKPFERITVENAEGQRRIVPRWVFSIYLSTNAPQRGSRRPWREVESPVEAAAEKKALRDVVDPVVKARQAAIEFKTLAFLGDTEFATFAFESKRLKPTWDPKLPPKGGFRCPPGTRYGGRVTDRFGRNCGWTVSRRLGNRLENVGRRMGEGADERRDRRVQRRVGRAENRVARAERRAERAVERAGRLRAEAAQPGRSLRDRLAERGRDRRVERLARRRARSDQREGRRRERAGRRADRWGRIADRLEPGEGRRPRPGREERRRERAGRRADRWGRIADRIEGSRAGRDRRRAGREERRRERAGRRADRWGRIAQRLEGGGAEGRRDRREERRERRRRRRADRAGRRADRWGRVAEFLDGGRSGERERRGERPSPERSPRPGRDRDNTGRSEVTNDRIRPSSEPDDPEEARKRLIERYDWDDTPIRDLDDATLDERIEALAAEEREMRAEDDLARFDPDRDARRALLRQLRNERNRRRRNERGRERRREEAERDRPEPAEADESSLTVAGDPPPNAVRPGTTGGGRDDNLQALLDNEFDNNADDIAALRRLRDQNADFLDIHGALLSDDERRQWDEHQERLNARIAYLNDEQADDLFADRPGRAEVHGRLDQRFWERRFDLDALRQEAATVDGLAAREPRYRDLIERHRQQVNDQIGILEEQDRLVADTVARKRARLDDVLGIYFNNPEGLRIAIAEQGDLRDQADIDIARYADVDGMEVRRSLLTAQQMREVYDDWIPRAEQRLGELAVKSQVRDEREAAEDAAGVVDLVKGDPAAELARRVQAQRDERRNHLGRYLDGRYGDETPWLDPEVNPDIGDLAGILQRASVDADAKQQWETWARNVFEHSEISGRDGARYRTVVTDIFAGGNSGSVNGKVQAFNPASGAWEDIGVFSRSIEPGRGQIYNSQLMLGREGGYNNAFANEAKNGGFQTVFNQHAWMWAKSSGFKKVGVSSAADGPYVWGRMGFRPRDSESYERMSNAFARELQAYRAGRGNLITNDADAAIVDMLITKSREANYAPSRTPGHAEFIAALTIDRGDKARQKQVRDWVVTNAPMWSGDLDLSNDDIARLDPRRDDAGLNAAVGRFRRDRKVNHDNEFAGIQDDRAQLQAVRDRVANRIDNPAEVLDPVAARGVSDPMVVGRAKAQAAVEVDREYLERLDARLAELTPDGPLLDALNIVPREYDDRRGRIADIGPDGRPTPIAITNSRITTEAEAVEFVRSGGSLGEVPNRFWLAAISQNASNQATDRNTRFRQVPQNGGAIGDTRIYLLRNEDGTTGNQGFVVKGAERTSDSVGEVIGYNLAVNHGLMNEGAGWDGISRFNARDRSYVVVPHAFNVAPDGTPVLPRGGNNYDPNLLANTPDAGMPEMLGHFLHNYLMKVSDRHEGNGMTMNVDGKAVVVPIDLGWAGRGVDGTPDDYRQGQFSMHRRLFRDISAHANGLPDAEREAYYQRIVGVYDQMLERAEQTVALGKDDFVNRYTVGTPDNLGPDIYSQETARDVAGQLFDSYQTQVSLLRSSRLDTLRLMGWTP
jgi:hypothetical protein